MLESVSMVASGADTIREQNSPLPIPAPISANSTINLLLVMRGDVGGFSVGSKFTWNASAVLGYSISRVVSLGLGYRALYVDY